MGSITQGAGLSKTESSGRSRRQGRIRWRVLATWIVAIALSVAFWFYAAQLPTLFR
jgi:hypothetical protein